MPRKNRNKNSKRSSQRSGTTTVVTLSSAWDLRLATSSDRNRLIGKDASFAIISSTAVVVNLCVQNYTTLVTVGSLGYRPYELSLSYTRYKINKLLFKYFPTGATNMNSVTALGVADDAETPLSATIALIPELRCSKLISSNSTEESSEFEWMPVDRSVWYYTSVQPTASAADQRFQYPGAFLGVASIAAASGIVVVYYDITFDGARPYGSLT